MAPEQVRDSSQIDHRADLWALGAILYELVTGQEAFHGESPGEIFASVLHATPPSIRALRPDVPPELDAVVARCLTREREGRFQNVAELARALAPLASRPWNEYAERIEQTLTRPQRLSDPTLPPLESGPMPVGKMRGRFSSAPVAPPSEAPALGSVVVRPDPPRVSQIEQLAAAPITATIPQARQSGRWRAVLLDAVMAAATVAALTVAQSNARERATVVGPRSGGPPLVGAMPTASLAPTPWVSRASPPSAPSAAGASPVPADHRNKSLGANPAPPAAKHQASSNAHLPSVLGSPD
jgi:serine/threonine-protein kinase